MRHPRDEGIGPASVRLIDLRTLPQRGQLDPLIEGLGAGRLVAVAAPLPLREQVTARRQSRLESKYPNMQTTAPATIAPGIGCSTDILGDILTRVGGSLGNSRRCCSRTLAQFVTTLLPITCLISPARAIVYSSSMAGVAGKKGQGGCHEQYQERDDQQ